MKQKKTNKNGYRTLKLRLLIVLVLLGGYIMLFSEVHSYYYKHVILLLSGIATAIVSIIILAAPITIRNNGHEQSV